LLAPLQHNRTQSPFICRTLCRKFHQRYGGDWKVGYLFLFVVVIGVIALARSYYNSRGRVPAINRSSEAQQLTCQTWIRHHVNGAQPIKMICGPVPAGFDHDRVLCVLPAINLLEPRAVRRSSGTYGGPTIRLMKGLSFRFGSGTSQSESFDELRHIDSGTLVLTTKRLAFLGDLRTTSAELGDLIGIHAFADGIKVHRARKQRAEHYQLSQMLEIPTELGTLAVVGSMIQAAIQMAKLDQEIVALEAAWALEKPEGGGRVH
jgi:hypothetical protein